MKEAVIGMIAGVLTSASMLPQLIKVIREKNVDALSPVALTVLILGVALWTYYGILKHELPIALTNGFAVIVNGTLLFYRFKFRNRQTLDT
jgi:MtN3 and saliva related transmembrane protein